MLSRRRPGAGIHPVTFRGRDVQSASDAVRAALGEHAVILRVLASREGHNAYVEIVAAGGSEVERFSTRLDAGPLPPARDPNGAGLPPVIALVGPSGAGKTTALARLATHRQAFGEWKVGILTLDTFRMGAIAELRGYAEIAGLPLEVAYDEAEVDQALAHLSDCDVVLMDTPGRRPVGREGGPLWSSLLQRARPDEVHLVIPAGMRPDAAHTAFEGLGGLGISHLLVTKLDEVAGDRGVADIALEIPLPTRWVMEGQALPGAVVAAPARILAALAELGEPATGLRISA
jgi:flagellar biosynthesis protein FlhF